MAQILFGFGGVRFDDGQSVATFSGGSGLITYTPIQIKKENIDYNIISRLLGYRVTINTSELYNIDTTDYLQYQYLARILSGLVNSTTQRTVTIYPRDDDTITNDVSYECILTSDFSPQDIHRLKTGQNLSLSFTCTTMQDTIPTTISDTGLDNLMFNTDNAKFNTDDAKVQIY